MIDVEVQGLNEFIAEMERMGRETGPALETAMELSMERLQELRPPYPATRPGQRYERTLTLGKSFATAVSSVGNDVVGAIGTNLVYAPWVVSTEAVETPKGLAGPQAWMHEGRWWTLQKFVAENVSEVGKQFEKAIAKMIGR